MKRRGKTSHVLHFIITLLTGGLWLPVWIIATVRNKQWVPIVAKFDGWCQGCNEGIRAGQEIKPSASGYGWLHAYHTQ